MAASGSSLPTTRSQGERRRGNQAPHKEMPSGAGKQGDWVPSRKLGLRHSVGGTRRESEATGDPKK